MELDFQTVSKKYALYEEVYKQIVEVTIKHLAIKADLLISVSLIHNELIHQINKEYRGVDYPTDVISFAFLDNETNREELLKKSCPIALGDIYISIEKAEEQAKEYHHNIHRELCFLFVHGLLHLLGYDHMKEQDEKVMLSLQEIILEKIGV